MKKVKKETQGELIDEVRKARSEVWNEFKSNRNKFLKETRRMAKKLGIHYSVPNKNKTRVA